VSTVRFGVKSLHMAKQVFFRVVERLVVFIPAKSGEKMLGVFLFAKLL
jgi:hypothetical protein